METEKYRVTFPTDAYETPDYWTEEELLEEASEHMEKQVTDVNEAIWFLIEKREYDIEKLP